MTYCEKCEKDLAAGEGHGITTEYPSWDSPGDGFNLCDDCFADEEDHENDRLEAIAEERRYG